MNENTATAVLEREDRPLLPFAPTNGGCPTDGCNGLVTNIAHPETMETCKTCLGCGAEWDCVSS